MNSRERVQSTFGGEVPDKIPVSLSFYHVDIETLIPVEVDLFEYIDIQFVRFPLSEEEKEFSRLAMPYPGDTRIGSLDQISNYSRWNYRPGQWDHRNPLSKASSIEDLYNFPFPDVSNTYRAVGLKEQVEHLHHLGKAAGGNLPHLGGELFEAAWRLRGLENFLLDLIERPDWAHLLLDRLTDLARRNAETLAYAGVDVLSLDDDIGMPGTMIISPTLWRTFFSPRMKLIIQSARQINPSIRVLYHSDGYYESIIPDLIEIGVDAINPIQPEYMDAERIRSKFGTDIVLWGTVGTQTAFSFNSPEQLKQEVKHRINSLGRSGLVLCPAYDIDEPDIPWQNILAFLNAAREFG